MDQTLYSRQYRNSTELHTKLLWNFYAKFFFTLPFASRFLVDFGILQRTIHSRRVRLLAAFKCALDRKHVFDWLVVWMCVFRFYLQIFKFLNLFSPFYLHRSVTFISVYFLLFIYVHIFVFYFLCFSLFLLFVDFDLLFTVCCFNAIDSVFIFIIDHRILIY